VVDEGETTRHLVSLNVSSDTPNFATLKHVTLVSYLVFDAKVPTFTASVVNISGHHLTAYQSETHALPPVCCDTL
jgi:hypothetical protein